MTETPVEPDTDNEDEGGDEGEGEDGTEGEVGDLDVPPSVPADAP